MELLALLSSRDDIVVPHVKGALKNYTVYPLKTIEELEDLYGNIPLGLLLIDISSHKLSALGDFLNRLDSDRVVIITPQRLDRRTKEQLPPSVFGSVDDDSIMAELPAIVERALERQRFRNELRLLKQSHDPLSPLQTNPGVRPDAETLPGRCDQSPGGRYVPEKVVVNFAKMLTASFDMRKLFDHFVDSVLEIARVSRMSIMLREKDVFNVKAHHGLDPHLADHLQLRKDGALASRLARTGRIMNKPVNFFDTESINIRNEMDLLRCSVSFPMIHNGRLIGIFNIDSKVTEEPFYKEELEIIYLLCSYLAAAVKDIDLYHHMWYQKEFTKNILSSMSSGMIAVDRDEKITVFNQQASEILDLDPSKIIGGALSALPSPLGDILYETMVTGNAYRRHEATLQPSGLPVGINSYRLLDEHRNPAGAGIIFSDLSDSRKLEEQRGMAEKLRAVNDLMAKIAHEVRNPLTSIQTYIQLLNEKQTDDDLHNFYISTVSQSIHRLDRLIDKLVTFSSTQNYNFNREDINDLIACAVDNVSKNLPRTHRISRKLMDGSFYVSADRRQLIKAIYYLVQSIVDMTPDGTAIEMNAIAARDALFVEISIVYEGGCRVEEVRRNLLKPLLDINNLETELNVPISHKIIEGHNGNLDIKNEGGANAFVIRLPVLDDRRGASVPFKGGSVAGQ
ncbi:MAG: PAS domain-containing protein [Nitrospiraceae bacterium]|nr:MAG: PAS domain-containing protein [Nitrospiraceae bacterium]